MYYQLLAQYEIIAFYHNIPDCYTILPFVKNDFVIKLSLQGGLNQTRI